jgi:diguanylate cyclase (GGDEF)-like protein
LSHGGPTVNRRSAAGLQQLIDRDQLTGLLNRQGFERELRKSLESERGGGGAVVKFGIDNFRTLNASRGHVVADLVLTSVASTIALAARAEDAVARIDGDTFAMLLRNADRARAEAVASDVLASVRGADLDLDRGGIRATVSAGIALLDRPNLTHADVLLDADLAMARAKEAGRDRLVVSTEVEQRPFQTRADWAEKIRAALATGSLELYCQPVQQVGSAHMQWELLLRLPEADGQLVPPSEFLPIAERYGMIEQLDAWVVSQACSLIALQEGRQLEVNVAARSLADPAFVDHVRERLAAAKIEPANLIFEVNELAFVDHIDEMRILVEQLRALGCRFALDNFGTRHASLAHLKQLPLDFVKIDGAFVRHLVDDEGDRRIVRAVIELAHGFGQEVIAVFVGNRETEKLLTDYGADYLQGFHVGRPRPAAELG